MRSMQVHIMYVLHVSCSLSVLCLPGERVHRQGGHPDVEEQDAAHTCTGG
jgi:hypothetical protein